MKARKKNRFSVITKRLPFAEKKSGEKTSSVPFKKLIYLIFLINLITAFTAFAIQKNLPPEIPLYFGLPQGTSQLSLSIGLIIPAAVSLTIAIVNVTLAVFVSDDYLKKALIFGGLGLTFFSTIAVFKIAQLVGSF